MIGRNDKKSALFYPNKPVILPVIRSQESIAQLDDAWQSDAGAATAMSQTASGHGSAENTYTAVLSHCFSPCSQIDSVAFHSNGIFYISHQSHWNLNAYFDKLKIKSRTDGQMKVHQVDQHFSQGSKQSKGPTK